MHVKSSEKNIHIGKANGVMIFIPVLTALVVIILIVTNYSNMNLFAQNALEYQINLYLWKSVS